MVCGVSQPPGMNICVKQKKDEKGGRVNGGSQLGIGIGMWTGVAGTPVFRCLSGTPYILPF